MCLVLTYSFSFFRRKKNYILVENQKHQLSAEIKRTNTRISRHTTNTLNRDDNRLANKPALVRIIATASPSAAATAAVAGRVKRNGSPTSSFVVNAVNRVSNGISSNHPATAGTNTIGFGAPSSQLRDHTRLSQAHRRRVRAQHHAHPLAHGVSQVLAVRSAHGPQVLWALRTALLQRGLLQVRNRREEKRSCIIHPRRCADDVDDAEAREEGRERGSLILFVMSVSHTL